MEPRLQPLAAIYALNTDLLVNGVEGVSDGQAKRRLDGGGNSIAVLAAHMAEARYYLANLLGAELTNPLAAMADASSIDEIEGLPPLSEIMEAWAEVSGELQGAFGRLTAERLDGDVGQTFPVPGGTAVDAIAFLAQHDSYHLGQVAFLRRQLGLPAMSYERPGAGRPGRAP